MAFFASPTSTTWRSSMWWLPDGRQAVQHMTLRVLLVAVRENLLVAPLMRQLASEQGWFARRRLNLFASRLEAGTPLVDALEQTPGILGEEEVLTLRLASQSGTFSGAYDLLQGGLSRPVSPLKATFLQTLVYCAALATCFCLVFAFLMTFVAPMFRQLFEEFGLNWPSFSEANLVWQTATRSVPLILIGFLAVAILEWLYRPLRYARNSLASRFLRGTSNLRTVHLLRLLGMTATQGRPLTGALSTLARYHYDANVRSRLLFARNETEQGSSVWTGLRDAGLLRPHEAKSLQAAASSDLSVWLMQRIADEREQQVQKSRSIRVVLLHPILIIAAAFVVGWIVITFFTPLIVLINTLG